MLLLIIDASSLVKLRNEIFHDGMKTVEIKRWLSFGDEEKEQNKGGKGIEKRRLSHKKLNHTKAQ